MKYARIKIACFSIEWFDTAHKSIDLPFDIENEFPKYRLFFEQIFFFPFLGTIFIIQFYQTPSKYAIKYRKKHRTIDGDRNIYTK